VPLSTQEYKCVPANCWGNLTNCGEVTPSRGSKYAAETGISSGSYEPVLVPRLHVVAAPAAMSQSWFQGFTFSTDDTLLYSPNLHARSMIPQ